MAIVRDKVYIDIVTETKKAAGNLLTFAAAAAAAAAAIKLSTDLVKSSVVAFAIQEQVVTKLKAVLLATGGVVGITSNEMLKMASAMQDVTKFGDEAVIKTQAMLVTFRNIGEEVFPRALEATLDLAEMFGTDLQGAAVQLGKALNDPILGISALTRVGVTFSQKQKDLIRGFQESGDIASAQTVILKELENQFGGLARAARDTASGALAALKNALGDLKEASGEAYVKDARPVIEWLIEVIEQSTEATKQLNATKDAMEKISKGASLMDLDADELTRLQEGYRESIEVAITYGLTLTKNEQRIQKQIDLIDVELGRRATVARWMARAAAVSEEEKKQGIIAANIKAAAAAKNLAAMEVLDEAWVDTNAGQLAALESSIAYFETFTNLGPEAQARLDAVLAGLRSQRPAIEEAADAVTHALIPAWERYGEVSLEQLEAIRAAQQEADDARTERSEQMISDAAQVGGQVMDIWAGVAAARMQGFENEKHAALEAIEAEIEAAEAAGENTEVLIDAKLAMEEDFAAKKKQLLRKEAVANKATAIFDIGINTASAIVEALPRIGLAIVIGALGAIQAAVVASTPIPSFATGGDFVTSGEQLIRVGDNPSGRERVRIDPDPSPDGGDGTMLHATFVLDGRVLGDWITKASRDQRILTSAGSIV